MKSRKYGIFVLIPVWIHTNTCYLRFLLGEVFLPRNTQILQIFYYAL